ncbi:hypothetical protein ACFYZ5_44740 [Streptomyces chartreusis]|uniref:hypothetical protein n=1 Tax=Streptomyces chartreusis TaxID=1969 RepID=UPI00369562E1
MGLDPLTKRKIYLYEQAATLPQAEKVRTKLLHQVDENRHPKTQVTMSFLLDRWLGVAELDESSYERAEGIIRNYLKPTFGELKAAKLNAEMLELFYARLRQFQEQCEGRRNGKSEAEARLRAARPEHRPQDSLHPAAGAQPRPALGLRDHKRGGPRRAAIPTQAQPRPTHSRGSGPSSEHRLAAGPGLGNVPVHDDGHRLTPR